MFYKLDKTESEQKVKTAIAIREATNPEVKAENISALISVIFYKATFDAISELIDPERIDTKKICKLLELSDSYSIFNSFEKQAEKDIIHHRVSTALYSIDKIPAYIATSVDMLEMFDYQRQIVAEILPLRIRELFLKGIYKLEVM